MLAVDAFTVDGDAAALTLSTAARRLFASSVGEMVGGSAAAAEAVLHSLRPLLAWLHESLDAVLGAIAGRHGSVTACDHLRTVYAGIRRCERDTKVHQLTPPLHARSVAAA